MTDIDDVFDGLHAASDELERIAVPLQAATEIAAFVHGMLERVSTSGYGDLKKRVIGLVSQIQTVQRAAEAVCVAIDEKAAEVGGI